VSPRARLPHLLLAVAALAPGAARAQEVAASAPIALERMSLALDPSGILGVEGGGVLPLGAWQAGAWVGFADEPLVVQGGAGARRGELLSHRAGGALAVAVGLAPLQLALELPFALHQEQRLDGLLAAPARPLPWGGVGDLRATAKLRLLGDGPRDGELALVAGGAFPNPAGGAGFVGPSRAEGRLGLAASRAWGRVRAAGELQLALRRSSELLDQRFASELAAEAGLAWRPLRRRPSVEALGSVGVSAAALAPLRTANETAAEARGALAWDRGRLRLLAGGGAGLLHGWGAPAWRAFLGVQLRSGAPRRPVPLFTSVAAARPASPRPGPAPAPRPAPPAARVVADRIELADVVEFDLGRAELAPRSHPLLDAVARAILARPDLGRVRVEGHTDASGSRAWNLELSQRRAESVVEALAARGVARERLEARGVGPDRPLSGAPGAEDRNRRVEFHVVRGAVAARETP
jgi:outer membrane protein OmpA-like peptidoglycan-associated protein